ncbi:hypothetical protein [Hydrogenophaga palleronii]|uniref:hypothetical protein n=1 Tax=Hydrogenophaga palleronii TaxID=65655 RepID=UPI000B1A6A38|nr:hypothetical protein [Hydrogenophaga palleronii]
MGPTKSTVQQGHLRPYLSAAFLEASPNGKRNASLADALLKEAEALIPTTSVAGATVGSPLRAIVSTEPSSLQEQVHVATLIYSQSSVPSWLVASSLVDQVNHLVVVAVLGNTAALICSDPSMRDVLAKGMKAAQPLSVSAVSDAFIGAEAKTLWLSGVHASTAVKADSKTLNGSALENALDPIGDQSYALSAIRSQPRVQGLGATTQPVIIGAAPSASRIWLGRPANWSSFLSQTHSLLKHLKQKNKPTELYHFLSKPVISVTDVAKAHSLAVLPAAMLADEVGVSAEELREAGRWAYDASYTLKARTGANFSVEVSCGGVDVGTALIEVSANANGRIRLSAKWTKSGSASDEDRKACAKFLTDPEQVKIYYNSGHAITDGNCYLAGWTDHVLSWEFEDLSNFNLWQEKPALTGNTKLPDAIDVPVAGEKSSLFTYVQQVLFKTGWLACDDGAMELADFVHLHPATGRITLIHVKGAGTKKGFTELSVSDYEVVVSQGVKNIRHLSPQKLAEALEDGAGKQIARAIWLNGTKQTDRSAMIAAIRALPASAPRTLLILQPRLTEKEHDHCVANASSSTARVKRFKQLNALMLGARVAAMGAGAEFRAIAVK